MPKIVKSVKTNAWRVRLAASFLPDGEDIDEDVVSSKGPPPSDDYIFLFGEGGWTDSESGRSPVEPSPELTDITAGDGAYANTAYYADGVVEIARVSDYRISFTCFLDTDEGNDDGDGNSPEFYELGVYSPEGVMILYQTFPVEVKTASRSLQHVIYVDF